MLEMKNVSLQRGKKRILNDLSLQVEAGECLGIIGPNGSGKSTLLQAVLGFLPLSRGSIEFQKRDIHALSTKERAQHIAYVAQDALDALPFTVESFLQLAYFPWQDALDFAEWQAHRQQLTREFKLEDKLSRQLGSLSGGEKQRVFLVQSLLQRPQVLLLDEITNHLDIAFQLETLQYLRAQPLTKIMVLHDINLAARFCDRLVLLKDGACLQAGPVAEVLTEASLRELFGVSCEIIQGSGGSRHIIFGSL